ncbi:MAG: single-stranded DNA-binding protein [Phycisphaerae bacterium]|nr:single-stranded DNA-binding protein [Phycisphaerae bacterium]
MAKPCDNADRSGRVEALVGLYGELRDRLKPLRFAPPAAHVYHTLDYAFAPFEQYLRRYAVRGASALLLGMNPGPWGMVQTGVPFGDVQSVGGWLAIDAGAQPPTQQHPQRPILGLACPRVEVSGQRIWGWAQGRFGSTAAFFERFFVLNYCPLAWLTESGANLTPDKLPAKERLAVEHACDAALRAAVEILAPRWLIGVGKYAEQRAKAALSAPTDGSPHDDDQRLPQICTILHPSPASPAANRGWAEQAERQLAAIGIDLRSGRGESPRVQTAPIVNRREKQLRGAAKRA